MMKYTDNQKKVLSLLLDKYERSKTYQGANQVHQTFGMKPENVWQDYISDYTAVELIRDFESEMQYLQEQGLLQIQRMNNTICRIEASNVKWEEYYTILDRKKKSKIQQEQKMFFESWEYKNIPIIQPFCKEQVERISNGKKPLYDMETAENLFKILEFIQKNKTEILERELSILMFGDSKVFQQAYRSRICKLICTYTDFQQKLQGIDEKKEQEKIVLEEYSVYTNPSYIYLKGECRLLMKDGREIQLNYSPIAISSQLVRELEVLTVVSDKIITVENLTSFHRICENNCTYIYLAGYHNSAKQDFLKKIFNDNTEKQWFHFGDIDPDGLYILEHLKSGTGIEFQPLYMDVKELKKYNQYCKPLNDNDRIKAQNLLSQKKYEKLLNYMMENNCKLEQEILGWH